MQGTTSSICSCPANQAVQFSNECVTNGTIIKEGEGGWHFCPIRKSFEFSTGDIPIFDGNVGHIGICITDDNEPSPLCRLAEANINLIDGQECAGGGNTGSGCADNRRVVDTTGINGVWRMGSCY